MLKQLSCLHLILANALEFLKGLRVFKQLLNYFHFVLFPVWVELTRINL